MARHVRDEDDDLLRISKVEGKDGEPALRLTIQETGPDGEMHVASFGRVDPHQLIEVLHAELGWDRPATGDCPGPMLQSVADQINAGELKIDGQADAEEIDLAEDHFAYREGMADEKEESSPQVAVHRTPATAEEPRMWAGADEPIIDSLIGRVADLEDGAVQGQVFAHQHLSDHWERRLKVVEQSLTLLPEPGKRGGVLAAFAGEDVEQVDRVEKALKIARFAADEHRDIPGVDL